MYWLGTVVRPDTLIPFGFNYAEPCMVFPVGGKTVDFHAAYDALHNQQLVIAAADGHPPEFFVGVIPEMSDDDIVGAQAAAFVKGLERIVTPENKVAPEKILARLEELTRS